MTLFFLGGIFLIGLLVGSFLNCIIYRLNQKESFLQGRSYCPKCQRQLAWYDLIPVLSFLILRGKCRYCGEKISIQYPLVELGTGIIFLLIFNFQSIFNQFSIFQFLNLLNLAFLFYIASSLIVIFVYDLKHYIIPDKILFPAIAAAFLYQLFRIFNFGFVSDLGFRISDLKPLVNPLASAILASAFFLAIILISRGRWMGLGDFKLAIFMGLFLGWPNILAALFFAFLIGAIIGLGLIILGKKGFKSEIPFGPFLITGTFIGLFWGQNLISWYLKFIL